MHFSPSEWRAARRHPRARLARGVLSALVAVGVALGVADCAPPAEPHDGGAAPTLSAPTSASPLWPDYTPSPTPESGKPTPAFVRYLPVEKVRVPSGGVTALSAKTLLERDPNVPAFVQMSIDSCPRSYCPMRAPVHRDLTGDGRDELVVAVDLPKVDRTLLQVYWASRKTVRPILVFWGPLGLAGDTYGRDLLVTATGDAGRYTTRFRWNGEVMAAVTPDGATSRPEDRVPGGIAGPDIGLGPDAVTGNGTSTDTRTDTRTTP
ncbi:hypothetical protein HUT19_03850 [Streptomyces sp. NA02950]|uniref:hypothetical protein n=1 Tax=Streptomyces sp. NA02950 TaxID=2742137 RepID=UPI0015922877|nr:hypothetical protein [Streptomyces sp. NA02950]QKV90980.1 hypothetical protein HUT19_03850 [Streptomyces sp. NA02950]